MRRLSYIFVLLLSAFPVFGQRVYLRKEYLKNDIYVINNGTLENPDLEVHFLLSHYGVDSTFIVVRETDLPYLNVYLRAVRDKYSEWPSVARENNIDEFRKSLDLHPPELRIQWTQRPTEGYWLERLQVKGYQTGFSNYLPIEFFITKGGTPIISGDFRVTDETDEECSRNVSFSLSSKSLGDLIKWADIHRIRKAYLKNRPKMTAEEINALFE